MRGQGWVGTHAIAFARLRSVAARVCSLMGSVFLFPRSLSMAFRALEARDMASIKKEGRIRSVAQPFFPIQRQRTWHVSDSVKHPPLIRFDDLSSARGDLLFCVGVAVCILMLR